MFLLDQHCRGRAVLKTASHVFCEACQLPTLYLFIQLNVWRTTHFNYRYRWSMKRDLKSYYLNMIKTSHCQAPSVKHLWSFGPDGEPSNQGALSSCCLNVGPASKTVGKTTLGAFSARVPSIKTVGNFETALGECPVFAGRATVWYSLQTM